MENKTLRSVAKGIFSSYHYYVAALGLSVIIILIMLVGMVAIGEPQFAKAASFGIQAERYPMILAYLL